MTGDRRDNRDIGTYPDAELSGADLTQAETARAARVVERGALNAEDRGMLLDMCGLADADGSTNGQLEGERP